MLSLVLVKSDVKKDVIIKLINQDGSYTECILESVDVVD